MDLSFDWPTIVGVGNAQCGIDAIVAAETQQIAEQASAL
jgi:hypothetical protein